MKSTCRHPFFRSIFALCLLCCALGASGEPPERAAAEPRGPNPFLSFLPVGAEADYEGWRRVMQRRSAERFADLTAAGEAFGLQESEPNDTPETADPVPGFGTGPGESPAVSFAGVFEASPAPTPSSPFAEDEGSLPLASAVGLAVGGGVAVQGTVGDGPFGSSGTGSGDHDFFRIDGVLQGQAIVLDVDTPLPMGDLDSYLALYDGAGTSLALNEDGDPNVSFDSYLAIPAPYDDDFYVSVSGSLFPFAAILSDPFDSSTGFGVGSEGDYTLTLGLDRGDPDWVTVELEACDVLGASLTGAGVQLLLQDPDGETLRLASSQDLSDAYSDPSPLPGGGRAVFAHVAATPGTYAVRALGDDGSPYTLELRVFRQPLEDVVEPQKIFVDFDGATVDPTIFGFDPGAAELSPLSSFLVRWGLTPGDLDGVIDGTLHVLRENLLDDPRWNGPSRTVVFELLNSRDHADPGEASDVARLVIGGSIAELGIPTIGIAPSIDVGNFDAGETAVVLLDLLSGSELDPNSLNSFPRAEGASMVDFVGRALGNIAAHEAGHYLGGFHTEQDNPVANLMDRGGNLPNTLGLGPDGIFGTEDDVDVDFGQDLYVSAERFAGFQDTLAVVSCGLSGGAAVFQDGYETGNLSGWSVVPAP